MALDLSTTARLMEAIKGIAGEASRSTRTVPAVCTRVDGDGTAWVRAVGSSEDTPIDGASTSVVEAGDMVNVDVSDGTATIVGNMTSPSVGSVQLGRVTESVKRMGSSLMESIDTAGGIAGAAERVAKAINQHFFADTNGIHVTQVTQEEWAENQTGPNVLINSIGQLFRDGLRNLVSITHGAVAFYDGAGNEASNVTASFGATGAQIGKDNARHAVVDSDGLTVYNADGTIAPVNATVDGANIVDASIVGGKIQGATLTGIPYAAITNADIEVARVADAEISSATITQAQVQNLSVDYARASLANVSNAWIDSGVVRDGAITNAMINSVSANKLTAGTIDASNITVTNLNADNITTGTINGQRIGQGSLSLDKLSEDVYTETEVNTIVDGLNDRIDGAIETHTGTAVPTLNNQPASSWNTTKLRDEHVGDVYYVVNSQSQQNGYCYRFTKSGSTYSWQLIKDSDVTAALSRLTTAEGKITTFDSDISTLKTDTGTLKTKTESLETRMSDAEDDILDKVDTTTFNEVSDTVDQHSQTITQMSQTLSNKADGSTVTALTTRVSKTEQDITGVSTTIGELQTTVESKADISTVETVSNKLNTVSDTVDGHTQSITSINNTLETKADSSTVTTLTTKVNTIEDTVDGHTSQLTSITSTQTTMQSTLDKTVKSSIQLWYSKANTTAPSKPTSQVTSTSTSGNAWRIVVPAYNSSYPHYYYCWQYEYADGTYGWSAVVRDIAMGESQSTARTADSNASAAVTTANTASTNASTALSTANTANTNASDAKTAATTASTTASEAKTTAETAASDASTAKTNAASAVTTANSASTTATNAQNTANANIKSSVQLWFTKANSTAPSKPTSVVSTSNANTANAWNLVVPVWNKNYPHYFYCYQQQKGDGNYQWTDVVYDRATSEAQQLANTTSTSLSTLQTNYATFKQTTTENVSSIGTRLTTAEGKISTAETSISHNTDAIALRATKTEVQQVRPAYANSSTAAGTAAKVATIDPAVTGYALYKGTSVAVTFSTANTAATPTLNLNSTGAKQIRSYTGAALSEAEYKWAAGATIDLVYDGTYWRMQDGGSVKRVTAAEASIRVNAGNIESKVSKDGVISSINQSAETVKIQASKVEIDGTAIFTAISSDVDDAITSKSYATTTQAQGYASTAKSEAISAAASDATTKANAAQTAATNAVNEAYKKLRSQGIQLVTNGNGFMGDNTNWPALTFDGSKSNGSPGSFTKGVGDATILSAEMFPVDVSKEYLFEFDAISSDGNGRLYSLLDQYDVDGKSICAKNVLYFANTLTTLAKDLNTGDTTVTLTSASNWASTSYDHQRALIFWDYKNSYGYTYPTETYSRNYYDSLYTDDSKVNKSTGVITLKKAWAGPKKAKGTYVSQGRSGNYYVYAHTYVQVPTEWTHYSFVYSGLDLVKDGADGIGTFRQGTAFAKVGFLWNYNYPTVSQGQIWVTNVSVKEATAKSSNAVKRTQRIWYRTNASSAPATPGTASSNWVTKADDGNDAWTKMHIAINSTHKYIYTCEQYEMADGTLGHTDVLLDNTITVIDGGNIITGSVTANEVDFADATGNQLKLFDPSNPTSYQIINGTGNEVFVGSESVASFGASARVGKSNGDRVVVDSTNGVTVYKANSKRLQTSANGMEVYGSDGSTSIASFGSSTRVGSASGNNVLINTNGLTVRSGTTVWSCVMQGSKTWLDHVRKVTKTATVTGLDILGGFTSGGASLFASPQTDGVNAHLLAGNPSSTNGAGIDIASVRRWSSDASKYDSAAVEAVVNAGGSSPYARLLASSGDRENVGVMVNGSSDRPITLTGDNLYVKSSNNGDGVVTTTRAFPCRGMKDQNTTVPAGGYKDISVSFNHYYTSAPTVVVGLNSSSTSSDIGQCSVAVVSVSTAGFTARLFNASAATRSPGFYWIALG